MSLMDQEESTTGSLAPDDSASALYRQDQWDQRPNTFYARRRPGSRSRPPRFQLYRPERRSSRYIDREAAAVSRKQNRIWEQLAQLDSDAEQAPGRPLVRIPRPSTARSGRASFATSDVRTIYDNTTNPFSSVNYSGRVNLPQHNDPPSGHPSNHFRAKPARVRIVEPNFSSQSSSSFGDEGYAEDEDWDDVDSESREGSQDLDPEELDPSEDAEPEIPDRRIDIIHDPSQATRDITVRLEMELEEDWELDIDEFCRLRRLGRFKDAKAHFASRLEHLSHDNPYIRLLYADMLLACGDYKSLRSLPPVPNVLSPDQPGTTPDDRYSLNLVATNYGLLDVLSQRREPLNVSHVDGSIRSTLTSLRAGIFVTSTETQVLAMCYRVWHYLAHCTRGVTGEYGNYASHNPNGWEPLYRRLLAEGCIWDFRDLFVSAVSIFGWEKTVSFFFGTYTVAEVLDTIVDDWTAPLFDEGSTMGLLDLFTSLILQDLSDGMKDRNLLLLEEATPLAESAQNADKELMKSRPFIQWLLAQAALRMEDPPPRPDGVRLQDFRGLIINQGNGVHLPIYVPTSHNRKPDWDMFFSRSSPDMLRVVEVAVGAAREIGDYNLEADALKLLILQSQHPKKWMDTLANLQHEIQGDKSGYLATSLSRYLVVTDQSEEAVLLKHLLKSDEDGGGLCFETCENASLTWAWKVIRIHLTSSDTGSGANGGDSGKVESPFNERTLDVPDIPPYIAEFARKEFGIISDTPNPPRRYKVTSWHHQPQPPPPPQSHYTHHAAEARVPDDKQPRNPDAAFFGHGSPSTDHASDPAYPQYTPGPEPASPFIGGYYDGHYGGPGYQHQPGHYAYHTFPPQQHYYWDYAHTVDGRGSGPLNYQGPPGPAPFYGANPFSPYAQTPVPPQPAPFSSFYGHNPFSPDSRPPGPPPPSPPPPSPPPTEPAAPERATFQDPADVYKQMARVWRGFKGIAAGDQEPESSSQPRPQQYTGGQREKVAEWLDIDEMSQQGDGNQANGTKGTTGYNQEIPVQSHSASDVSSWKVHNRVEELLDEDESHPDQTQTDSARKVSSGKEQERQGQQSDMMANDQAKPNAGDMDDDSVEIIEVDPGNEATGTVKQDGVGNDQANADKTSNGAVQNSQRAFRLVEKKEKANTRPDTIKTESDATVVGPQTEAKEDQPGDDNPSVAKRQTKSGGETQGDAVTKSNTDTVSRDSVESADAAPQVRAEESQKRTNDADTKGLATNEAQTGSPKDAQPAQPDKDRNGGDNIKLNKSQAGPTDSGLRARFEEHRHPKDGPNTGKTQGGLADKNQPTQSTDDKNGNNPSAGKTQIDNVKGGEQTQAEDDQNDLNSLYVRRGSQDSSHPIQVEAQDGLTNLKIPQTLLEGNYLTILVKDRKGGQGSKTYIVDESGIRPAQASTHKPRSQSRPRTTEGVDTSGTGSGKPPPRRQSSMGMDKSKAKGGGGGGDKTATGGGGGARAGEKSHKEKKRDRWQDRWFPQRKPSSARPSVSIDAADPWSLFTPGTPGKAGGGGDEVKMSGAIDGGRSLAERFKLKSDPAAEGKEAKEAKEPKGKEKEVINIVVPPSAPEPPAPEAPKVAAETEAAPKEKEAAPKEKKAAGTAGMAATVADGDEAEAEGKSTGVAGANPPVSAQISKSATFS